MTKKITQLPAASTPLAGTELLEIVQGGVSSQATAQDVADLGGGAGTPPGANTQGIFNDGGAFGADAGWTYDKTNNRHLCTGGFSVGTDPALSDFGMGADAYVWAKQGGNEHPLIGVTSAGVFEIGAGTGLPILIGSGLNQYITVEATEWAFNVSVLKLGPAAQNRTVSWGTGAPVSSPADGSVYFRTDGDASTGIYTMQGGVWSAVGGGGGGGTETSDTITWSPTGAPNTEVESHAEEFAHDGSPADQEGYRVEIDDGFSTDVRMIVQCAGPGEEYFRREIRAAWVRDGSLVREKDAPSSTGDATENEAGYDAVLALDGTDAVLTVSGEGTWSILVSRTRTVNGVKPILVSVTPSTGLDTAGGETLTLAGARFVTGAQVTIGGTACTGESVTDQNEMTAVTPAKTGGSYDVVVTNPDTKTATLVGGATFAGGGIDPATLDLAIFVYKGNYTAGNWPGRASVGTSATRDLTQATGANQPAVVGDAPDYQGDVAQHFLAHADDMADIGLGAEGTIIAVYNADAVAAYNASPIENAALFSDFGVGGVGLSMTDAGFEGFIFTSGTGYQKSTEASPSATGAHHFVAFKWNGGTNERSLRVNGGTAVTSTCAAAGLTAVTGTVANGVNYDGAKKLNGKCRLLIVADTALDDATIEGIRTWAIAQGLFA